ncbi:Mu-like prophage major head subunit gpT family protein [Sphingomonas naphthae]|uniref:Mu-like prophage major head subunit gpT family protein n=1 Tax=Sphingomonas naphthae TaxID=1813468 RepID=A0ABY7TFP8_9SPHN|nr:Mu-like prophage major head subunit gpT family protein [Sphingomonas naphthae]WCT72061.1 Mu-like prophage major head subunit gpT family protein [Sphingomonas naphthae]
MLINGDNLRTLGVGFNAAFSRGVGQAESDHLLVATPVPSSTKTNEYGWLGKIPSVREWLGPRVVQNISSGKYEITNRPYELTVGVDRDDIEDDNIGQYTPLFEELGRSVAAHPSELVYALLKLGSSTICYDGQYFFDTDHPVLDEAGTPVSVSNYGGGSGPLWVLVDDSRALKPIIYQMRRDFAWVKKDKDTDDNVFERREFLYGVDGRMAVGFAFWQFAYASRQPLTVENYEAAYVALASMKGDYGRPLGLRPRKLIVPPALTGAATAITKNQLTTGGATNQWQGTSEAVMTPWLA